MISGPKYKIARRLGAPIFEKTQTQKYTLSQSRKAKPFGFMKPKSNFGSQMLEKQKARLTYGVTEKQFKNYVLSAMARKDAKNIDALYEGLEMRLDNAIFRIGFAPTRRFARQMVSHGHIMVNGKKVSFPSFTVSEGDVVSIRPQSATSGLFTTLDEKMKTFAVPNWVKFDYEKKEGKIQGKPKLDQATLMFDLNAVLEFYSR